MNFVRLRFKRNRGWPWPQASWGLDSMFGPGGWCHECGIPRRAQCGPLTLQASSFGPVRGAWSPNWRFDAICLDESLATQIRAHFTVELREVAWKGKPPGRACQIVAATVEPPWFDPDALRARAIARHGVAGSLCADCGTWRWMPVPFDDLPPLISVSILEPFDVAASPELLALTISGQVCSRKMNRSGTGVSEL